MLHLYQSAGGTQTLAAEAAMASSPQSGHQDIIMGTTETIRRAQSPAPLGDIVQWIPVMVWFAVIFTMSTESFSANNTGRIIEPILRWLFPAISGSGLASAHYYIRKSAHFIEYVVLFWLLVRGPMKGRPHLALALCALYAFGDEGHQIFVPGRTPSLYDVGLDFSGALFSRFLHLALIEIA
jgi:VanZ family protein